MARTAGEKLSRADLAVVEAAFRHEVATPRSGSADFVFARSLYRSATHDDLRRMIDTALDAARSLASAEAWWPAVETAVLRFRRELGALTWEAFDLYVLARRKIDEAKEFCLRHDPDRMYPVYAAECALECADRAAHAYRNRNETSASEARTQAARAIGYAAMARGNDVASASDIAARACLDLGAEMTFTGA